MSVVKCAVCIQIYKSVFIILLFRLASLAYRNHFPSSFYICAYKIAMKSITLTVSKQFCVCVFLLALTKDIARKKPGWIELYGIYTYIVWVVWNLNLNFCLVWFHLLQCERNTICCNCTGFRLCSHKKNTKRYESNFQIEPTNNESSNSLWCTFMRFAKRTNENSIP